MPANTRAAKARDRSSDSGDVGFGDGEPGMERVQWGHELPRFRVRARRAGEHRPSAQHYLVSRQLGT
jgi:hypothetical protein